MRFIKTLSDDYIAVDSIGVFSIDSEFSKTVPKPGFPQGYPLRGVIIDITTKRGNLYRAELTDHEFSQLIGA